jgi:hypothetical protein
MMRFLHTAILTNYGISFGDNKCLTTASPTFQETSPMIYPPTTSTTPVSAQFTLPNGAKPRQ